MKIAYLSTAEIPSRSANSVHIMKMCQAFAQNGHRVTLYARKGQAADVDVYRTYGVRKSFEIRYCRMPFYSWAAVGAYALNTAFAVKADGLPDILYARNAFGLSALAHLRVPMIFESHRPPTNRIQKAAEARLYRKPNLERLVVISDALREEYLLRYPTLDGSRVIVAHDGADPPADLPAASSGDWAGRPGVFQVGYVGHLYPGRGVELIFALAERMPDADFHLVGGTEADIASWRARLDVGNLFIHGYVPHGDLGGYYRRFDAALAPYQDKVTVLGRGDTSKWMSPLKLFEYMSYGKAIVASDMPAIREVLTDGETAILSPPDDLDAWTVSLQRLGVDARERRALGDRAYTVFADRFSWSSRANEVLRDLPAVRRTVRDDVVA